MKAIRILLCVFLCMCGFAHAVPPATWQEVGSNVATVIQATRLGDEPLLDIFSAALEVEKKATVQHRADAIAAAIRKTTGLTAQQFSELRQKHSFFDLAIGYGLSRVRKMGIVSVLQEREIGIWQEILPRFLKNSPSAADEIVAEIGKLVK